MRIVYPKDITLVSSNIEEDSDGYSEWSSAVTYALNDFVYLTRADDGVTEITPHKIYKSLSNSNLNHYPGTSVTKWMDCGGTNRWKMFDEFIDTQSINDELILATVDCSNCDRFALFNLDAEEVEVILIDNDQAVSASYLKTTDTTDYLEVEDETPTYLGIERPSVASWLYNTVGKSDLVGEIYFYNNSQLVIAIKKPGGSAKCGICIVGKSEIIGDTLFGIKPGITDYSIKDIDEFGRAYLSVGSWAKDLDAEFIFNLDDLDDVYLALVRARGSLVVVECNGENTDFESLNLYGWFKDWEIKIDEPSVAFCSFNFQGVI